MAGIDSPKQSDTDDEDYWESRDTIRSSRTKRPNFVSSLEPNPTYQQETFYDLYVQPCLAEFVGSLMLVYIGAMAVRTDSILSIAIGHGFILTAICVTFGRISGAHVNPAVTVGALIGGSIGEIMSVLYIFSQVFGGIIGSLLVRLCVDYVPRGGADTAGTSVRSVYDSMGGGGPSVAGGLPLFAALVTEAHLTFMLVLVVLMSTARERDTTLAPVAIGLTLTACIIAGAPSTGAALNPIRAFGPAVANFGIPHAWTHHWVYWLGPILGGSMAGLLFKTMMAPYSMRLFC